jgi:hypothetical protein
MQNSDSAQSDKDLRNVIKINEAQIQDHLGEMVRSTKKRSMLCWTRRRTSFAGQNGMSETPATLL